MRIIHGKRQVEIEKKKAIEFEFGCIWGVSDMNNEYKMILMNLYNVTKLNNVELQLKVFLANNIH
jgi:hypothetical protein